MGAAGLLLALMLAQPSIPVRATTVDMRITRGYLFTTYSTSFSWSRVNLSSVTMSAVGVNDANSGQFSDAYGSPRFFASYETAATAGPTNATTNHFSIVGFKRPYITFHVYVVDVASVRIRVGVCGSCSSTSDGANSDKTLLFRYSTNASDTNWMVQTGNGTAPSQQTIDSGVAVAANTGYHFTIDWSVSGYIVFSINGVPVHVASDSTYHPSETEPLHLTFTVGSLDAATRAFKLGSPVLYTELK